jgi:vitamin B12 transporter
MNQQRLNRQSMAHFSRWSRKRYAIFNSLHRVVKICTLSVGCAMFACPVSVNAQVADSTHHAKDADIDEVIVTAGREPVSLSKATRMVTVISRSETERAPIQSLDALLDNAPSLDVRQRGGYGIQSDVSIRGGNFEQTLILLNGMNMVDPQTGHFNMNLPIAPSAIQRIEILQGPAARIFGANAFSGVINLITGTPPGNHLQISGMGGQYGLHSESVNLGFQQGKFNHFLSLFDSGSDGAIANTDFYLRSLYYKGQWKYKNQQLDYQAGYNMRGYGANSFYSAKYPNQYESNRTFIGHIAYQYTGPVTISPSVYWRRNYDKFELFRSNPASWYTGNNYHQTNVYGANLNTSLETLAGKTSFGANFRREEILSNNIGTLLTHPIHIAGTDTSYIYGYHRNYTGLFADQTLTLNRWSISTGLLLQETRDVKTRWDVFPGLDLSFRALSVLSFYAGYNSSLRMPSFTDLFYKSATQSGDVNLRPEKGHSYEIGTKYNDTHLEIKATGFIRKCTNLIDWIRYDAADKYTANNITSVTYTGLETYIHYLFTGNSFIKEISGSYSYVNSNRESNGFQSMYALDHLKHKANFSIDHKIWNKLSANWQANWQQRKGNFIPYDNGIAQPARNYPSVWLVDVRLQWSEKSWKVYAETANLFDKKWYDIGSVEQPGIWFRAGFSYNLDL